MEANSAIEIENDVIEAGSSPQSLADGWNGHQRMENDHRQSAMSKGMSTFGGRSTVLYPPGNNAEGRQPRNVMRRPADELSRTNPLTTTRTSDCSTSSSPDQSSSDQAWDDADVGAIERDYSKDVKRMRTVYTAGDDHNVEPSSHSRRSEKQQRRKALGRRPPPQQTLAMDVSSSTSGEPLSVRVETAMSLHGKGKKSQGTGMALEDPTGQSREQQPMSFMTIRGGLTIDENDTRRFVPEVELLPTDLGIDDGSEEGGDGLLVPKIEPGLGEQDDSQLDSGMLGEISRASEEGSLAPLVVKRPRGRPRKHPLPVIGDALSNLGKGRSKTGCITCRKRKKKCDEGKPSCLNCLKNAVLCEGYQPLTTWRSGKEKAASEGGLEYDHPGTPSFQEYPASLPNNHHRSQTLQMTLPPIIHGVDTPTDKLFFAHYMHRLSDRLTIEGRGANAFRDEMIPMAVQHIGLMHSILSLSAASIHWDTPYGESLLRRVPDVTVRQLEDRGQYHQDAALEESRQDLQLEMAAQQRGETPDPLIMKVRFGQLVCFVVKAMAEGNTEGAHRLHLNAYNTYSKDAPSEGSSFMNFIREFFQYHICSDQLLIGPPNVYRALSEDEFWNAPETQMTIAPAPLTTNAAVNEDLFYQQHGALFGLEHDVYRSLMHRIGSLRNDIRVRMEGNEGPHLNYLAVDEATQIETEIRNWADPPEPQYGHAEESAADKQLREREGRIYEIARLYKQMLWLYLYRTIYTPSSSAPPGFFQLRAGNRLQGKHDANENPLADDPRIKQVVDYGIELLQTFEPSDPCQTVLLTPAFVIGCASFEDGQRSAIRRVVRRIRNYTTLRNTDATLRVLEEVWRRMDGKGETVMKGGVEFVLRNSKGERDGGIESSWDWEKIAREMELDFLAA